MGLINSTNKLTDIPASDLGKMEYAAIEHKRFGNITFKIIEYDNNKLIIQAAQGKNAAAIYHSKKRIIEIVNETFGRFFIGKRIIVHPITYSNSPVEIVNKKWIDKKMLETGTKLKDISADTGISKIELTQYINDKEKLTQPIKSLFYYYFLSLKS